MSSSEEIFASYALQSGRNIRENIDSDPSRSIEVFRNKTTAVEVIVKEVPMKRKVSDTAGYETTVKTHLQEERDKLKTDLVKARNLLEKSQKGFHVCICQIKKQLDSAYQREMDIRNKYLTLQLENEKLKSHLLTKTNLVSKLMKELAILKRIVKTVLKSVMNIPHAETINVSGSSDPDYDDFEGYLKKELKLTNFNDFSTFDSTPKEPKTTSI